MAFFSASRATFFRRFSEAFGPRWRRSDKILLVSSFRICERLRYTAQAAAIPSS